MPRELLKGNNAMAEAAVRAGVQAYFGYPDNSANGAPGVYVQADAGAWPHLFTG